MEPGLAPGERIIILKLLVGPENLDRFDIVVFRKPNDPRRRIIKRIVGCPGETVEIKEDTLYVNGQAISRTLPGQNRRRPSPPTPSSPRPIPPNHYYVVGDNWDRSIDSRVFGVVPMKNIIGKAIFRYWPLSRFGKIR